MPACSRYEDDLALLAGGDLDQERHQASLRAHVETCAGCAELLADLVDDRALVGHAALARGPEDEASAGLASRVLARLATESHAVPGRPRTARRHADLGLMAFGRAAAAIVVVVSAAVLGLSVLPSGHEAGEMAAGPGAARQPLPVHVRRGAGRDLELTWAGDGREAPGAGGPVGTYRVMASASARDFSAARPVEVAGNHLVLGVDVPSARRPDRSVTFFRVE